jgi:hypothetical protein
MCWSLIFVHSIGPMPFHLAQLSITLCWCSANLMSLLGTSISITKILYLTHFNVMFNLVQESISQIILGVSLLFGCVPPLIIGFHQSVNKIILSTTVIHFMGEKLSPVPLNPMLIYGFSWLLLSILMLIVATLVTKLYEKRHLQGSVLVGERNREARKTLSLPRVLIGVSILFFSVVISNATEATGILGPFPLQIVVYTSSICLMLFFFVLDENVKTFFEPITANKIAQLKLTLRRFRYLGCLPRISPA